MAEVPTGAARRSRWPSLLAATVGVALLLVAAVWLGTVSGPPATPATIAPSPTPTAASSSAGYTPYQLAEGYGPTMTIRTPADCTFLVDDWLRQLCILTLASEWKSIAVAPMTQSSSVFTDPPWWAAFTRAMIDGDTSFCSDWTTRAFMTVGHSGGSAPPPGATFAPFHPVATCIDSLRSKADAGSFTMIDHGQGAPNGYVLTFTVSDGAAARAAQGVAPSFDPAGECTLPARSLCDSVSAAATIALGDRTSAVDELGIAAQLLVGCPGFASDAATPAPCPPPSGGTWIGAVVAAGGGALPKVVAAFDIAAMGGQISLVEVPYHQP